MSDLLLRREGALGRITLNRPRALNALTHEMALDMERVLRDWAQDDAVQAVLLDGAGDRGLCAGGDIRSLYDSAREGGDLADRFWRDEYRMNAFIARYPKPYVAVMDGIVMGGGIGVGAHGSHRIVTERTRFAMPEVAIGFSPDVGGTWLLARAPGELGTCFALTAAQGDAGDAIACGLADHYVAADKLEALKQALAQAPQDVDAVIARFATPAPPGRIAAGRAWIDAAFAHDRVEDILAALEAGDEPARAMGETIRKHAPTSLKVTLRALREARASTTLEACLQREYRIATACIRSPDMLEGIRAAVVDKDRNPRWSPASLAQVDDARVAHYFAPAPPGDLHFESASV